MNFKTLQSVCAFRELRSAARSRSPLIAGLLFAWLTTVILAGFAGWKLGIANPQADLETLSASQAAYQQECSVRRRPPQSNRVALPPSWPEHESIFRQGRMELLAARAQRADARFERLAMAEPPVGVNHGYIAFYRGLCAESRGRMRVAVRWYTQAAQRCANESDCRYFRLLQRSSSHTAGPIRLASYAPGAALAQPKTEILDDVYQVHEDVEKAQADFNKDDSLENKILLLSWLYMFAEVAGDRRLMMYATALEHFDEANELWREVDRQRMENPKEFEALLNEQRRIAMRWDAIAVRRLAIDQRQQASSSHYDQRLTQLHNLVASYADCTKALAFACAATLQGDFASARVAGGQASQAVQSLTNTTEKIQDDDKFFLRPEKLPRDPEEFEALLQTNVRPFDTPIGSQLASVEGMMSYQYAVRVRDDAPQAADQALNDAEAFAAKSIREGTGDPANPLGHYVLGLVYEAQGLAATAGNLADREAHENAEKKFNLAQDKFDDADEALKNAQQKVKVKVVAPPAQEPLLAFSGSSDELLRLAWAADPNDPVADTPTGVSIMEEDIERRRAELSGTAAFLELAKSLTSRGRLDEARIELDRCIRRHREAEVWTTRLETAIRAITNRPAKDPLDDDATPVEAASPLQQAEQIVDAVLLAEKEDLYSHADYVPDLLQARAWLAAVRAMTDAEDAVDQATAARLAKRIRNNVIPKLNDGTTAAANDTEGTALCQAYQARAWAYLADLEPESRSESLQRAYSLAKDSGRTLHESLEDTEAVGATPSDYFHVLRLQEGLVTALVAYGLGAAESLPESQDRTKLSFHFAMDRAASLPYRAVDWKSAGTPLLNLSIAEASIGNTSRAEEIARLQRALARYADGIVGLQNNQPQQALHQFTAAASELDVSIDEDPKTKTAAAMFMQSEDPAEMAFLLREELATYGALAALQAKDISRARLSVFHLLNLDQSADWTAIYAAAKEANPLISYVLAQMIEEQLDQMPLIPGNPDLRGVLRAQADQAYKLSSQRCLLRPYHDRYHALAHLNQTAIARLESPNKIYLTAAQGMRARYRLQDAWHKLEEGLKRHPRDPKLWDLLIEVGFEQFDTSVGTSRDAIGRKLLALLPRTTVDNSRLGPQRFYWEGRIHERLGDKQRAAESYQHALADAEREGLVRSATRARAKLAIVRLNLAAEKAKKQEEQAAGLEGDVAVLDQ